MNTLVPLPGNSARVTPWQGASACRLVKQTQRAVFRHGVGAAAKAEMDRQDAQAAADANQASLDEELKLLRYGLSQAGASATQLEMVARKVQLQISIDERRVMQKFAR